MNKFKNIPWTGGYVVPAKPPEIPLKNFDDLEGFKEVEKLFSDISLLIQSTNPDFIKVWRQPFITSWHRAAWMHANDGAFSSLNREAAFLRAFGEIAREEMAFTLEANQARLDESNQKLKEIMDHVYALGRAEGLTDSEIESELEDTRTAMREHAGEPS